jgi:hypothetical protein
LSHAIYPRREHTACKNENTSTSVVGYPCYGTLPRARDSHVPAFYTDCGQVQRASQCCTMHADMHSFRIIIVVRTSHCNNKGQADHARCKYKLDLMVLTEVITGLHRRAYLNRHQFCLNRALNRHQFWGCVQLLIPVVSSVQKSTAAGRYRLALSAPHQLLWQA